MTSDATRDRRSEFHSPLAAPSVVLKGGQLALWLTFGRPLLLDFAEIGGGDEGGTEGAEAGEMKEEAVAVTVGGGVRGYGGVAMELDVELVLVALLAYHLATEALELAHDDLDLLAYLVLLLHDGHHVLGGAGGNDEVQHRPIGDGEGRILAEGILLEVVIVVRDDEGQFGDEPLVVLRALEEQGAMNVWAVRKEHGFGLRQIGEDQVGQEFLNGGLHAGFRPGVNGVSGNIGVSLQPSEEVGRLVLATIAGGEDVPLVALLLRRDVLYRHPILCIVAPSGDSTGGKPSIRSFYRVFGGCSIHIGITLYDCQHAGATT